MISLRHTPMQNKFIRQRGILLTIDQQINSDMCSFSIIIHYYDNTSESSYNDPKVLIINTTLDDFQNFLLYISDQTVDV